MKKAAIGISDFRRIILENYYFVDKSLLIKDVIDGFNIILYPRPRRFGKTLNLSMLKYFYDNSEDNSSLFKNLAISKEKEYEKKQGKYPVIFISFKDIKSSNYKHCLDCIRDLIRLVYNEHSYLLNSDVFEGIDKDIYIKIMNKSSSVAELEASLKNLTKYLFEHHKINPVILIDEYDMPIQASYLNDYYNELIEFIRNLLSGCLKDNKYLEKAVLTGILRVAKESIFSGLNNIDVNSIIVQESADKFGFTEKEVEQCLRDFNMTNKLNEVKEWYDGYNFGKDTEIYNPWSILNYIVKKELKPYWVNTSGNELIKNLLKNANEYIKRELETLLEGNSLSKNINDNIVYNEVNTSEEALWSFLLLSGYLRFDNIIFDEDGCTVDLSIPNKEVAYLYKNEIIKSWFSSIDSSHNLKTILDNLVKGNLDEFKFSFIEFCRNSFSYFDVGGENPEKFYHGFVLGLIASLRDKYVIKSNKESGYGRYDIMLIPNDKTQRGIIFEFKKVNQFNNEDFKAAMANAKKQIIEKKYADELKSFGIKDIVNIAAVFEKKEVIVEVF